MVGKIKMKVIQVITLGSELYGAQRHVIDLCLSLQSEGHEVILLLGNSGKMHEYARTLGIETHVLKHLKRSIHAFHDFVGVIELVQLLKKLEPDIVASHSSKAGILVRVAAWWLKIPNTFTVHGWSFAEGGPFFAGKVYQLIEKAIGLISCKVILISEADKEYALQLGVLEKQKMELIHHGIKSPPYVIKPFNYKSDLPLTMVMAARFQAQKDHETLVKALSQLKNLNWRLFFLGDGELVPFIKERVQKLGLSDKIFFEGAVDNVPEYLQQADVFLLISNWEGLPISILEAMSYGLPVIASDVAGVKEEVLDGVNGFVVPRKDAQSITSAISALYYDRQMALAMGEQSRERFEKYFTIDLMIKRTIQLYKDLAGKSDR